MNPLVTQWSIDLIRTHSWEKTGDSAYLEASNGSHDSCSFDLVMNPVGDAVVLNFNASMNSNSWYEKLGGYSIEELVVPAAETALIEWDKEIRNILEWLPKGMWRKGPGSNFELEYAALSFLVEKLNEFGGLKNIQRISVLLEIERSAAKERVRECRNRELLTTSGKGVRGYSIITAKARKLLEREGVINAKKGK